MPYLDANYSLPYASQSETSRDAALAMQPHVETQEATVYRWFVARGSDGGTQRECSQDLWIGRPSVAARVHALERQGRLVKTDRRRAGCAVYTEAR